MRDLKNVKTCGDTDAVYVMTRRIFDYIDKDKNGLLDTEELLSLMTLMSSEHIQQFQGVFSHMTDEER